MVKATAVEIELHNLIQSGNALALSKLFDSYGGGITTKLKSLYPKYARINETLILQSVNDAFLGYYRNPNTFNIEKNTLKRFLEIAAERDLINLLSKERKHIDLKNELPADVELEEKMWNSIQEEVSSPENELIVKQTLDAVDKELRRHFKKERDIELAKLIISDVRETGKFSDILNIVDLEFDEQQKHVKRHKDRIKKILERHNIEVTIKGITI